MNIIVVGLSHRTATVEIREKVAFSPNLIEKPLRTLVSLEGIVEGVIVSTCNRVEIYATTRDIAGGIARIKRFMADHHRIPLESLEPHLYSYHSEAAIRHVFRVASSLDSMVIGEPQILGQIKTSYGYAAEYKSSGIILNRFLHKAFSVAKRVRTETKIASSAVSVAFAAVELAKKVLGDLSDKTVMLVGAGEMCELAAKHFINSGAKGVMVTNRTFERAERLADEFKGEAVPFEELFQHLHRADIVLSSTGAPHVIITPKDVTDVVKRRKFRPMFFIDIAVPRDIDPKVDDVDGAFLFTVDDLQEIVQANLAQRNREAEKAEEIIDQEIGQFYKWLSSLGVTPTIVALRSRFDEIRRTELEKTISGWKELPPDSEKRLEALTMAIMNKLLHAPTTALKQAGQGGRVDLYVDALRQLFDLQTGLQDDDELELEE
ncbi:glutamyl-tRNA reductase [Pelotalea chapellei]|uniref:Glutamyl-tRNA reductase n=1 Tax=Pelotalea chapellei TaxID=44671 RepID=A0ABS5U561_9BACT|nr:glutamyl-tRNA reductase [Pelotalea chapellei]MBT1070802.1 glutamyl-tRNA reductase [Pelotalea chapellei]